jgi:hypothetical protein
MSTASLKQLNELIALINTTNTLGDFLQALRDSNNPMIREGKNHDIQIPGFDFVFRWSIGQASNSLTFAFDVNSHLEAKEMQLVIKAPGEEGVFMPYYFTPKADMDSQLEPGRKQIEIFESTMRLGHQDVGRILCEGFVGAEDLFIRVDEVRGTPTRGLYIYGLQNVNLDDICFGIDILFEISEVLFIAKMRQLADSLP